MTDHADLIVRLKRHREVMGRDMLEWELVNHDGPEAASAIDALMNDVRVLKADLDRSEDNVARLIVERDEARMKLSDMHRRAQAAEAAVYEKLSDPKTGPVTLGRMLATAAYHREAEAREKAEAERDEARALLREARGLLVSDDMTYAPIGVLEQCMGLTIRIDAALKEDKG